MNFKMNHQTFNDHSHQVYHFFDQYRTPFAVLCASSLYAFFQVTSKHRVETKKGYEKFLTRQLHFSFITPFMLSLVVLLISTMTVTTILRGDFDPKAETAYELVMKEFKFEYVAIQWCCIISIISMIRGVYIHAVVDHRLFDNKKEEFAMVVTDLFSFITGALAYINSSLYSWDSFYGMTCDLFKVSTISSLLCKVNGLFSIPYQNSDFNLQMIWHGYVDTQKPLRTLSLFSAGITMGLFLKVNLFNKDGIFSKFIHDTVKEEEVNTDSPSSETTKKHQ